MKDAVKEIALAMLFGLILPVTCLGAIALTLRFFGKTIG